MDIASTTIVDTKLRSPKNGAPKFFYREASINGYLTPLSEHGSPV